MIVRLLQVWNCMMTVLFQELDLPKITLEIRSLFFRALPGSMANIRFMIISLAIMNVRIVIRMFLGTRMARSFDVKNAWKKFPIKSVDIVDQLV